MLAAVLHDFDELALEQVPRPRATEIGTVVVRIKSCGICATDYKAIKGIRKNVNFPFIPGHEPSGIVAEVGIGVTHFKVGDQVICQPSGYCGFCRHCRTGDSHYCDRAFTTGAIARMTCGQGLLPNTCSPRRRVSSTSPETCLLMQPASQSHSLVPGKA